MQPDVAAWASLVERNRAKLATWDFEIAGEPVGEFRALARSEFLAGAREFSSRLGVPVRPPQAVDAPIVATGHQPDFYHPGIWVKCFLLQHLADECGATPVDVVVDSDGFGVLAVTSPCMRPEISRCRQYLAVGKNDGYYAGAPAPNERAVSQFCAAVDDALSTLPAPAVSRHFREFCGALRSACADAGDLAESLVFARRRYERTAGTDYLELPVTHLITGDAFRRFVAMLVLDAERFARAVNEELDGYRAVSGTRSMAQPFPNLAVEDGTIELPLWHLDGGVRRAVRVCTSHGERVLAADGDIIAHLSGDADAVVSVLESSGITLAPKAITLTMFLRMFVCDLFIHGVGGGRYDRVTDGVIRRYFGVEPPELAVASLTLYLPIGAHLVTDEEIARASERLNRLAHNPDALIGDVDFKDSRERERATELAAEKAELVREMAEPGADKKALGARIRSVNKELASLLEPVREQLAEELRRLRVQRDAADVLTDRTYPFCFWDPAEVADKVL